MAEIREQTLKEETLELAAIKKEGAQEKARDIAKKLLKMEVLTFGQIAEATGLCEEDVSEIQKNL